MEGQLPEECHIEYYSRRPHIDFRPVQWPPQCLPLLRGCVLGGPDFRRAHRRRPAYQVELRLFAHDALLPESRCQAEVDQLHARRGRIGLEAEVLQLYVAVANTMPMAIGDRPGHLPHQTCRIALCVPALQRHVVVEVHAVHALHHKAQNAWLLEDLDQAADVGVIHHQLVLHFRHDPRQLVRREPLGRQHLDGHLHARGPIMREEDVPRHALAEHRSFVDIVLLLEGARVVKEASEAGAGVHLQRGQQPLPGARRRPIWRPGAFAVRRTDHRRGHGDFRARV
mmetsp:Transcript_25781/g.74212  ORF Transcript_25781/g.74212 Transcript_25781/m.74212 type:complete len:283 (+) Transcript_25781:691-1539(+)